MIGFYQAKAALGRGHEVTIFHRGETAVERDKKNGGKRLPYKQKIEGSED